MKYQVVVVRDLVADLFGIPNFVASVGGAIRGFQDEVNREDQNNALFKHPDDFELMHLGAYDDQFARFEPLENGPRHLILGRECRLRNEPDLRLGAGVQGQQAPLSFGNGVNQ